MTPFPVVAVLVSAEQELGPNREWTPQGPVATRFFEQIFAVCRNEVDIPEIHSICSRDITAVNSFLKVHGFGIQLDPFPRDDDFGAASILDVLVEWLGKGEAIEIETPDQGKFPGVALKTGVSIFTAAGHPHPVVSLKTKSADLVFLTMLDNLPAGYLYQFDLISLAEQFSGTLGPNSRFEGVRFPMVTLDQGEDISWLVGSQTTGEDGRPGIIFQALQQTKFRMNEVGARVQSAAAVGLIRGRPRQPHVINRPFLLWITRPGLTKPLFTAYITETDWKNPGSLA